MEMVVALRELEDTLANETTGSLDPVVGTRSGSSAINRLARSARALASFASYADPLLIQTEIVS
jgi:hypothetical protein